MRVFLVVFVVGLALAWVALGVFAAQTILRYRRARTALADTLADRERHNRNARDWG